MKYKAGGHYEGELLHGLREGLVPWGSGSRTTNVVCLNSEARERQELAPHQDRSPRFRVLQPWFVQIHSPKVPVTPRA